MELHRVVPLHWGYKCIFDANNVCSSSAGSNNAPVPSLHNLGSESNKYEMAIKAVGSVIEHFIANRTFKAYGFGVNFGGTVSHDFNMDLGSDSPDCVGVEGACIGKGHGTPFKPKKEDRIFRLFHRNGDCRFWPLHAKKKRPHQRGAF